MRDETSGRSGTAAGRLWELRLDSRRPLPEVIEDKLRELIEAGEFVAGQQLPNEPERVTYGPPPAADGDRPAYLYDWDPVDVDFVLRD